MAKWIERLTGVENPARQGAETLARLNASKEPVRIGIEGSSQHFVSRLRLRGGGIVLNYPRRIAGGVRAGDWLRVHLEEGDQPRELRIQVSAARYGGAGEFGADGEQLALLCKLSGAEVDTPKRRQLRVSTEQFRDVTMSFTTLASTYRIVDLSLTGAKLRLESKEQRDDFPIGKPLPRGTLNLGRRSRVALQNVLPRHYPPHSVGMEINVTDEGASRKIFEVFLDTLLKREWSEGVGGSEAL